MHRVYHRRPTRAGHALFILEGGIVRVLTTCGGYGFILQFKVTRGETILIFLYSEYLQKKHVFQNFMSGSEENAVKKSNLCWGK